MVEIDLSNFNDILVMHELSEKWDNDNLMAEMAKDASQFVNDEMPSEGYRFFAVTTQKDNFENLNPDEVLSFCEVEEIINDNDNPVLFCDFEIPDEEYNANIKFIQSNEKSTTMYNPLYKRCGSALLDGLKYYYNRIHLKSLIWAKPFYERNKFKPISKDDTTHMIWERGK